MFIYITVADALTDRVKLIKMSKKEKCMTYKNLMTASLDLLFLPYEPFLYRPNYS